MSNTQDIASTPIRILYAHRGHRWFFSYRWQDRVVMAKHIGMMAYNAELPFNWHDAVQLLAAMRSEHYKLERQLRGGAK